MTTANAASPPRFDLAYVISDLHIGGCPNAQMFEAARQFEVLTQHIIESVRRLRERWTDAARALLVINGDFVDFLAEPDATIFNIQQSAAMLERIFGRNEFASVLTSLQQFVATDGTHLVITLGNHDIELALPNTRRVLLQLLTHDRSWLEGKIELCFDGWGYRFQVAGRRMLCLHGNEADSYNFTRYDELDRILHDMNLFDTSEFACTWCPSAGTWFVINAINPIKKRFPFIDLLKPEVPLAATVLGVLDPSKVAFANEVAKLKAGAVKNDFIRPRSQRRMLSLDLLPTGADIPNEALRLQPRLRPIAEEIEGRAERALSDGSIDQLIRMPPESEMLGMTDDWVISLRETAGRLRDKAVDLTRRTAASLTGAARDNHWRALRSAVRPLVTDEPYDAKQMDPADRLIDQSVRYGYDVVFTGHTHFRRLAKRPGGHGFYVNTGTWAGLIGLTRSQVNSHEFEKVYDALRSESRQALHDAKLVRQECTVARLSTEEDGVTLVLGGVEKQAEGGFGVTYPEAMTVNFNVKVPV